MAETNAPTTPAASSMAGALWGTGDYDRLASYGSPAEAARLLRFVGVAAGTRVLDVGTGSGIVAITAARLGARVDALDPTRELLAKAEENATLAECPGIDWREGIAEWLPYDAASFDVVVSQYAHMFSAQPDAAIAEMLRVLRPGGRIAFAAWTPDGLAPRLMGLSVRYMPPMPGDPPASPFLWGDPAGVRRYFGDRVRDLRFEHAALMLPALSPAHARRLLEQTFGPTVLLVNMLDAARLSEWRRAHDQIAAEFFADGWLRFEYLLTRATKA